MRLVGIDYGQVRIGIAISDPKKIAARALCTIIATSDHKSTSLAIKKYLDPYFPLGGIVLGYPKQSGLIAEIELFASVIEQTLQVPIHWQEEHLTTLQADERLRCLRWSRKRRLSVLDKIAAEFILQRFLDKGALCS